MEGKRELLSFPVLENFLREHSLEVADTSASKHVSEEWTGRRHVRSGRRARQRVILRRVHWWTWWCGRCTDGWVEEQDGKVGDGQ